MIKSADVDKGGGENAYPQNVDKKHVFFFNPSLTKSVIKQVLVIKFLIYIIWHV